MRPVRVFVAARGNEFMTDIATWIRDAAVLTGRDATLHRDELPEPDGAINLVVAPHEFFELHDAPAEAVRRSAAFSVCVATEQPGTPWFELTVDACRPGPMALDINAHGVDALRRRGIDAHRLKLGGVPAMTAPGASRPATDRRLDVLFLGSLDERRGGVLNALAPRLWSRSVDLRLFDFSSPVNAGRSGLVFGRDKYELLSHAKILLNVHRGGRDGERPYFEWARMVEALANGCVVVTEPSEESEPLATGSHFVEAAADELADAIDDLLAQPDRLDEIARAGRDLLANELTLAGELAPLLARIEREVLSPAAPTRFPRDRWRLGSSRSDAPTPRRLAPFRPYADIQRDAKRIALAETVALQRLDRAACRLRHGADQHIERWSTSAARVGTVPEVSVVVTVYNYAHTVAETLRSIAASTDVGFEIVVVEDHATDDSREVLRRLSAELDDVAIRVLAKDANEGLAAARNLGVDEARAPYVMIMDADNLVYPTCLRRLADELTADPEAAAAYAILEQFGVKDGLVSAFGWDPERLCASNYIDAQAMWRRDRLLALEGYRAFDESVFGWEDWDLWLRLAESGGHAVQRREILGRYRVQEQSMISLTNLAVDDAMRDLRRHHPSLPWPG